MAYITGTILKHKVASCKGNSGTSPGDCGPLFDDTLFPGITLIAFCILLQVQAVTTSLSLQQLDAVPQAKFFAC